MSMSISLDGDDEVVSAINTTPLVDVMLVLLIIFLITIPVVTQTIPLDLPKETNQPRITKPENINLSVDKDGGVYWNDQRVGNTERLVEKLKQIAVTDPQPEVQIRGDGSARYEHVGRVVLACQRAGIVKIGFITEPPPRG
ncbi:biopolymer transporter ExbD [Propionivibrio sp.]|uniref:ExbD/TolR family protein n=1 Tax=Propionivibrio sp. TaxID=2212460 RepID=UPI002603C72B|nr:biopolymer transporter ExbD [Propionivibrio sp.]